MFKTPSLRTIALAVTSFFAVGSALAEGAAWQPEVGWGSVQGGRVSHNDSKGRNSAPSLDLAIGYRWESGLGIRALFFGALDPFKDAFNQPSARSFNEFDGLQATDYLPLASKLNLMTGLGVGQTSLNRGVAGDHQELTECVLSAGLQYNIVKYFSLELHADYLSRTHERNLVLLAEFPF